MPHLHSICVEGRILVVLLTALSLMQAFEGTFKENLFFVYFIVDEDIILRFNHLKNSFRPKMVSRLLTQSLQVGHFFLEDNHLNNFILLLLYTTPKVLGDTG